MSTPNADESEGNTSLLNSLAYHCAHCLREYKDSCQYDTIEKVFKHWKQRHTKPDNFQPFRFHAVDMITCFHCDFIGVYQAVKEHHNEEHPNEQFAVVALNDDQKCALCPFLGVNITKHFDECHKAVLYENNFNPTAMPEACLKELLKTNLNYRYQCSGCARCFDQEHTLIEHIERTHPDSGVFSKPVQSNVIKMIILPCCSDEETKTDNLFKHLESHQRDYKCPGCDFVAKSIHVIDAHYKVHTTMPPMDLAAHVKQILLADYLSTNVVFGTGLIVTKQNLLGTQFDDMNQFEEFRQNFLSVKRELMNDQDNDEEDNANAMVLYRHQ